MKPIQSNCILKKYIAPLLASVILVSLSSCHSKSTDLRAGGQGGRGEVEQGEGEQGAGGHRGRGEGGHRGRGEVEQGEGGHRRETAKDSRSDRKSALFPKPVETDSNSAGDTGVGLEDLGEAIAPSIPSSFPAKPARVSQAANTVSINIYKPDSRCQQLISEQVAVDSEQPIRAAVGKVLAERNTADFSVAGYRVLVEPNNGLATIDMRLKPDSPRKFFSLSSCEQFALFGSLRQTLTNNPKWQINTVRFTERGKDIIL